MRRLALTIVVTMSALVACRGERDDGSLELRVFAASSLTEAFGDLEEAFEAQHPGIDVQTYFAGSQTLRIQLEQGAEADVIATANAEHLEALRAQDLVEPPVLFASTELVVIVPNDNPATIETFEQLVTASHIVIGSPQVPIGRYTQEVFDKAEAQLGSRFADTVRGNVVSEETNVRLVRAKVAMGEADAAVVYRADTIAAQVRVIELPPEVGVRADYPIAATTASRHPEAARAFIAWLSSAPGRKILGRHGFAAAGNP